MKKMIAALLLTLTIALSLGGYSASAHPADDEPFWIDTPCQTQGSVNCRWLANEQGNGEGHSYIVRAMPGSAHMVCVMYIDRSYARHHDYCS